MSLSNYIKAFSPTHIISIVAGSLTLITVNIIPFLTGHPISNTAFIVVNAIGLVAVSYGNMKVGILA